MKKLIKGGLLYLLSCLYSFNSYGQDFVKFIDPTSSEFGKVLSPILPDSVLDLLIVKELSFPEWTTFYQVKIIGATRSVLGDYRLEKDRVAFSPRFLPDHNVTYSIVFNFNSLASLLDIPTIGRTDSLLSEDVIFESPTNEVSEVMGIYPSINVLPENALRLYLYFSKPMSFENPYDHISLRDQNGNSVENAFVELPEGLWNHNQTRLTVLFHPGRVKQGVGPNLNDGPVLRKGTIYEIGVAGEWKDANGLPLGKDFSKKFYVTQAQRNKLRKKEWNVKYTCKKECLLILSTGGIPDLEIMDKMIAMQDANGKMMDFKIYPEDNGTFLLRSDAFKKGQTYKLTVNPLVEDICGNTFLNAFDSKEGARVREGKPLEISVVLK